MSSTAPEAQPEHRRLVYSVDQIREAEQRWFATHPADDGMLMDRVAVRLMDIIVDVFEHPTDTPITILAGPGNNGGDALSLAMLAVQGGYRVQACCWHPGKLSALCQERLDRARLNEAITWLSTDQLQTCACPGLIVDGLLGTGCRGDVPAELAAIIDWANHADAKTLAIDVPSGLDGSTGRLSEPAIRAQATLTLMAQKWPLLTGDSVDHVGKLWFDGLGLGSEILDAYEPEGECIDGNHLATLLPPRSRVAHKYHSGLVAIVGGHPTMPGAGILAGQAAQAVGAGRVCVAGHRDHATLTAVCHPTLTAAVADDEEQMQALLSKAAVVVLGPGLGHDNWSEALVTRVLQYLPSDTPLLVDADGLRFSSHWAGHVPLCVTPHAAEAARLLGENSPAKTHADRLRSARQLASQLEAVTLLKGAGTLIAEPEQRLRVLHAVLPVLATAGTGDVLSGVIAGLAAQGMSLGQAAAYGAWLHAESARCWAELNGERGLDFSAWIPMIRALMYDGSLTAGR